MPGLLGLRLRHRSREGKLKLEGFFHLFLSAIGTRVPERAAGRLLLCGRLRRVRVARGRSPLVLETGIKGRNIRTSIGGFRSLRGGTKARAGGVLTVGLRRSRSMGYRDKSPGRCSPRDTGRPGGLDGGRTAGQCRRSVGGMRTSAETLGNTLVVSRKSIA